MRKFYEIEKAGQIDFFKNFRIDYENNEVLVNNTDGIYNGNLFEFKTDITDLNKVLFQAIKYLSRMRVKGESIPANILLVSLNTTTLYLYHSQDYFDDIHKIYVGAASKDNEGFIAKPYVAKYDYMDMVDSVEVLKLLKSENYMPVRIDEDCIVGWAERYYTELKNANKGDFLGDDSGQVKVIGEIREPRYFKGLILPYEGKTNEKFKYLMDKLNDRLKKKDLGAFYTPIPYAEKAAELVRMAIDRVPVGNDYIILDRCAGTGNLESVLTDEELSHCILSTYEYYEYKVLVERLGDKVRCIIPPIEAQVEYANGCVMNADAMSKEYIENPILQGYIQDPKCTIILYENPPYSDASADARKTKAARGTNKEKYVSVEFCKNNNSATKGMVASKDLANLFIWSGFNYYLRQPTDSYIVFSPIKYWKNTNIVNKKMMDGFLFNREYFHATASAIACIYWSNEDTENLKKLCLNAYDIDNGTIKFEKNIEIHKIHKTFNQYFFDKRTFADDAEDGIWCAMGGSETKPTSSTSTINLYNKNILAYMHLVGFNFDPINVCLTRCSLNARKNGFFIRNDNYIEKLPMFVAKKYPQEYWYEKDVYATTADGGDKYTKDKDFLKYCLIYTCLSNQNKCLSFKGSDGREYQNELCFDTGAIALNDLQDMQLNDDEKELIDLWNKILSEAMQTKNYDCNRRYGVYQITKELNTFVEVTKGKSKKKIWDDPKLNGDLNSLRTKLKAYYKKYITPKMFEYELIK